MKALEYKIMFAAVETPLKESSLSLASVVAQITKAFLATYLSN